ncbi:MAG: peptidylprolyl isomerase [Pseudomonadota bacterium]
MQFRTPTLAAAAIAAMLAAPVFAQDEVTADTVVATVNGTDITVGHMIALRARLPQQYQQLPDDVLFNGILDQIVQQAVIGQTQEALSKSNTLTLENERRALLANQVVDEVVAGATTDEAIQAAYDEAYGGAEPETEYNASHILVETEDEAAALVTELEGGADFATLAQENSTGPSGPNGGELGWFGPGMMVPEFEQAVVALEAGQVSAPVQTQFGWHVIKLNELRQKEAPALDDVRQELEGQVQRAAVDARIAELTEAAEITRVEPGEVDPSVLRELAIDN